VEWLGVEATTAQSQVQYPNHHITKQEVNLVIARTDSCLMLDYVRIINFLLLLLLNIISFYIFKNTLCNSRKYNK